MLQSPSLTFFLGLGDPYCRYPLLRKTLGYKQVWIYYVALVLDPILRFNWILFAIYKNDIQHTALLSFILAFTEVLRRGMWSVLRVEVSLASSQTLTSPPLIASQNEHCTKWVSRKYENIVEVLTVTASAVSAHPATSPFLTRSQPPQEALHNPHVTSSNVYARTHYHHWCASPLLRTLPASTWRQRLEPKPTCHNARIAADLAQAP